MRCDEKALSTTTGRRAAWVTVPVRGPLAETAEESPPPGRPTPFRWGPLVFLALLAGLLAFCHGCHADVDDELFSHGWWVSAMGR